MRIVLPLEVVHVMKDELQVLLAVVAIPRLIERRCRAPHPIREQPRLIKPRIELALDADLRLGLNATAFS